MATNTAIKGQKNLYTFGSENYVLTTVEHSASNGSSFSIDQSANSIVAAKSKNGSDPTSTLGSADSNGLKTVTLSGGASGEVEVITRHLGSRASNLGTPLSNSEGG